MQLLRWRQAVFWLLSRSSMAAYRRLPLFGRLRGAVGIVLEPGGLLVIERSDGLGLGLPGGICHRRETPEETLRRELVEETGLEAMDLRFRFAYLDDTFYPAQTFVFDVRAKGQMRPSWEGNPKVVPLVELEERIIRSQRVVVEELIRRATP